MWKHDEEFNQIQRRKVRIYKNGDFEAGKDLLIEPEWNIRDFLNACSSRLGMSSAKRVFDADGHEIDDCMMLEDDDILFLSSGDDFMPPGSDSGSVLYLKNGNTWETIPSVISGYRIGKLLGRGGFGEVRMGEHQLTKEKVALKFLTKAEIMSMGAAERTTTEIQCLSALKHAHIIRLQQHLESPQHVILVFELMEGGDLFHYLLDRQIEAVKASTECITAFQFALPEDEARHVFNQIVSALGYAHNQHICHRDLKLENILLKAKNLSCVKIADFGLSAFYRSALPALLRPSSLIFIPSSPGAHMKSSCGTLSFLAPEVFAGTSNAGPPLDVWALGVILFALLCGRLPFEGPDLAGTKRPREAVIRSRISKGQYKIEEGLSPEAKDLVRRMLRIDPSIRASVPEIFSHVWMRTISQNYDPHHSGIREKDVMSPLSLIQKLSLSSPTPAVPSPGPGTESRISTPRTSLKLPNLVSTTPVGVEREEEVPVIELEDAITAQSSSETELDNLPTFEMERVITKLRSGSTDVSAEDAIETLISGRRSSSRSADPDEISSSTTASPKASFILVPLRRNPQQGPKDLIPSPRRPKTAVEDEEFLAKFRQDTWDLPGDEPLLTSTTSRGRSGTEGSDVTHRVRQSTGSLSARLHPLQPRKHDNNGSDSSSSSSYPTSVTSSPSTGVHTARSHSQRKTLHLATGAPVVTWTEQLEDAKETLDTSFFGNERESGKHNHHRGTMNMAGTGTGAGGSVDTMPFSTGHSQNRSKHSQLHFAGTSSLKPHTPSSQPSTPTQTRRKLPSAGSSNAIHQSTLAVSGQGASLVNDTPNFLSASGRQASFRGGASGGSSSRLTARAETSNSSSTTSSSKLHR